MGASVSEIDADGNSYGWQLGAVGTVTLVLIQTGGTPLQITTTSLPGAASGSPYSTTLATTGGSGAGHEWSVPSGSLPTGFTLSSAGVLSSTGIPPAATNSYGFTVQVTDSAGNLAQQPLTLGVFPQECPTNVIHYPGGPYSSPPSPQPTTMNAIFAPITFPPEASGLAGAEFACGVLSFNWQQQIISLAAPSGVWAYTPSLLDPANISSDGTCPQFFGNLNGTCPFGSGSLQATPGFPLSDPPNGGYTYTYTDPRYPFYWSASDLSHGTTPCAGDASLETATTLFFQDCPDDPATFQTSLVGVLPSGLVSAPLYTWTWRTTFNGTNGGIKEVSSTGPPDPGSGTGGVTITSINGVQLPPVVLPSQVSATASGLAYSRVSQTFNGTVTLTNVSGGAISGPLQILFFGTPANVTLVNATGNLSGTPYLTVPAATSLAAGQSATVSVQFKNPSNVTIGSTPVIYSGSIN